MLKQTALSLCPDDSHLFFGSSCRELDFTIAFEQGILIIVTTSLSLLTCILTLIQKARRRQGMTSASKDSDRSGELLKSASEFNVTYIVQLGLGTLWMFLCVARIAVVPKQFRGGPIPYWPRRLVIAARALVFVLSLALLPTIHYLHRGKGHPRSRLQAIFLGLVASHSFSLRTAYRTDFRTAFPADTFLLLAFLIVAAALFICEVCVPLMLIRRPTSGHKKANIEIDVGVLGRATLFWLIPILWQGSRRPLDLDDLWPIHRRMFAQPARNALKHQLDRVKNEKFSCVTFRGARLLLALYRAYPSIFLAPIAPRLLQLTCALTQPFIISALINAVSPSQTKEGLTGAQADPLKAWTLVAAVPLAYLGMPFFQSICSYHLSMIDVIFKSSVISCVFEKMATLEEDPAHGLGKMESTVLQPLPASSEDSGAPPTDPKISAGSCGKQTCQFASGTIDPSVLMSVDVELIISGMTFFALYEILAIVPCVVVGTWMLYTRVGAAAFAAIGTLFGLVALGCVLSRQIGERQSAWLKATNSRVSFTSTLVANLRSIFASSYQPYFLHRSDQLRKAELNKIRRFQTTVALLTAPMGAGLGAAIVILLAVARGLEKRGGQELTPAVVFSSIGILNILNLPLQILASLLTQVLSALASVQRLESYLLDQFVEVSSLNTNMSGADLQEKLAADSSESEMLSKTRMLAEHLLAKLGDAQRCGVMEVVRLVGPGASGKTVLVKYLLQYLRAKSDYKVAYGPQSATLFDESSLLDNVRLFRQAKKGSSRKVGLQATMTSDQEQEMELLSNVLAFCSLDHDVAALGDGILTLVRDLSGGQRQRVSLARALFSNAPILVLDDPLSALDTITKTEIEEKIYGCGSSQASRMLSGKVLLWVSSERSLHDSSSSMFITSRENASFRLTPPFQAPTLELPSSGNVTEPELSAVDADSALRKNFSTSQGSLVAFNASNTDPPEKQTETEHAVRIGIATFRFYLARASWFWVAATFGFINLTVGASDGLQYTVQGWTNLGLRDSSKLLPSPGLYLSLLAFLAALIPLGHALTFVAFRVVAAPRLSYNVYDKAVSSLLATSPYNSMLPAKLKARFSQDIYILDSDFPAQVLFTTFSAMSFSAAAMTMVVALPWMALALPIFPIEFLLIRRLYLRSSNQVRSMELESKASLFAIFSQVYKCLPILQSLREIQSCIDEADNILNEAQKPFYTRQAMLRLLRIVFALVAGLIVSILAALTVALSSRINPTLLGVALINVSSLSWFLNATLQGFAQLETDAVAVDRIRRIAALSPEDDSSEQDGEQRQLSTDEGPMIECENMSLQYSLDASPVIRNITLRVLPGARIGICGRSGSGKSSFLAALLRGVTDPCIKGSLTLSGQSRAQIPLKVWRRNFSYVTQDPLIWRAPLREVLFVCADTISSVDEERAWQVLDATGLGHVIRSTVQGLDVIVRPAAASRGHEDIGTNDLVLSKSQLHLLAFARALLEAERPLLLLDELSSCLDGNDEQRCLDILMNHELTKERTVVAVSHRISFILQFDYVLLFKDGEIEERGRPSALLATNTHFKRLWEMQGSPSGYKVRDESPRAC